MGNVWYNEPKTLDTAFDVMGDIILSTAAQQYGGFTVPEVDKVLGTLCRKELSEIQRRIQKICGSGLGRSRRACRSSMPWTRCAETLNRDGRALSTS